MASPRLLGLVLLSLLPFSQESAAGSLPSRELRRARSPDVFQWTVHVRRELHKVPELMYKEVKTSAFIRKTLDELGIKYDFPFADTGIIAQLGKAPAKGVPHVALRADMDALPMDEEADVEFRSQHPGQAHSCGHDVHVAMLLAAAKLLKEEEDKLPGTVTLIFQPAEEGGAGALRMLQEDKKGRILSADAIFGLHVGALLPTGAMGGRSGTLLAATGVFEAEIFGKGGHGAMPHLTVDPIVAASAVVTSLQTIVSRRTDPLKSAVVSVTKFKAGTALNIIPPSASIGGTFRSLTKAGLLQLKEDIEDIIKAQAAVHGCNATVDFKEKVHPPYPATLNDPGAYHLAKDVAEELVGPLNFFETDPLMGGEDFAFFAERMPGCFLWVGLRNETLGSIHHNHSPKWLVDENALPIGAAFHVSLAKAFLSRATRQVQRASEEL